MTLYEELKARGLVAQITMKRSSTDQQRQSNLLHRL